MNKSNKTKCVIELENQIKKLRAEKAQLKKEAKSLALRLETAQRKVGQYKDELKKKEREITNNTRFAGVSNKVVARRWYSEWMIA